MGIPRHKRNAFGFQDGRGEDGENGDHMRETNINVMLTHDLEEMAVKCHRPAWLAVAQLFPNGVDLDIVRHLETSRPHRDNIDRRGPLGKGVNPARRKPEDRVVNICRKVEEEKAHGHQLLGPMTAVLHAQPVGNR